MRDLIRKVGRLNTVLLITLLSVLVSVTVTALFLPVLYPTAEMGAAIMMAILIPLITAPLMSWHMMGLLLEIDGLEKKMQLLVRYDFLTGLLSRQAFFNDAEHYVQRASQNPNHNPFAILALDLDDFKHINDEYGHFAGDAVLKDFANITKSILRESDLVGRIGGEEFVIFLHDATPERANKLAERLQAEIRNSLVIYNNKQIRYTTSIGLMSSKIMGRVEDFLELADKALYAAKEQGKDCTVIFNAEQME